MKALFTGLFAASLVGCASLPDAEKSGTRTPTASKVGAKYAKPIKPRKTKTVARVNTTGSPPASRVIPTREADPAVEKAKTAIGAMLEDASSAEFYNLKRAQKDLLHTTSDTICGYVKAKAAGSGGDIRDMPFLYTVDDDQAYLVNGRSQVAEIVHGALCK